MREENGDQEKVVILLVDMLVFRKQNVATVHKRGSRTQCEKLSLTVCHVGG